MSSKFVNVTADNFSNTYSTMQHDIKTADFVAIDLEFTGLGLESVNKPKYFQTVQEKYENVRSLANSYTILQFGFSCFRYMKKDHSYVQAVYQVYLQPTSFWFTPNVFQMEASAIKFLTKHNINFDMSFKNGVSYISLQQLEEIRSKFKAHSQHESEKSMSSPHLEARLFAEDCSNRIRSWLDSRGIHKRIVIPLDDKDVFFISSVLTKIPEDLKVQLSVSLTNTDIIFTQSDDKIECISSYDELQEELFQQVLGFTKILHYMVECKKPIVGHNCFIDFAFIFEKFFHPLPDNVEDYKTQLSALFPSIFDTKLAFKKCLYSILPYPYQTSTLLDMFNNSLRDEVTFGFTSRTAIPSGLFDKTPPFKQPEKLAHSAGGDSWMTGIVFLRFGYVIALKSLKNIPGKTLPNHLFVALSEQMNKMALPTASRIFNIKGEDHIPDTTMCRLKYVGSKFDGISYRSISKALQCRFDIEEWISDQVVNIKVEASKFSSICDHLNVNQFGYTLTQMNPKSFIAKIFDFFSFKRNTVENCVKNAVVGTILFILITKMKTNL